MYSTKKDNEMTRKKQQDTHGSVVIDGVTVRWADNRRMSCDADDPTEDMDLRGEYIVTVSVDEGEIDAIQHALSCAKQLKTISAFCDVFCPVPLSGHSLKLAGLDVTGDIMWRIVVDGRKCDAVAAGTLAQMDPAYYSESGPIAMKTVAWMRAVGRVTSGWYGKDDISNVLYRWDEQTLAAACLQHCQPAAQAISV